MTSDMKSLRTGIRVGSTYVYYLQHWSSLGRSQHGLLVLLFRARRTGLCFSEWNTPAQARQTSLTLMLRYFRRLYFYTIAKRTATTYNRTTNQQLVTFEHVDVEGLPMTRALMIPTPGRDLIGEILPTLSIITPVIPRQSMVAFPLQATVDRPPQGPDTGTLISD